MLAAGKAEDTVRELENMNKAEATLSTKTIQVPDDSLARGMRSSLNVTVQGIDAAGSESKLCHLVPMLILGKLYNLSVL